MPEHRGARLKARPLLDLLLEPDADPAEPGMAELVKAPALSAIVPSVGTAPSAATTIEK